MNTQRSKKGFTITELIIVIVVIAILAAVLIPTFISLVNKANLSADQQAVRQMNTILAAEEVTDKPATVTEAKDILIANGISDFVPTLTGNTFYWVGADNRVLLWTADEEDATKGAVTYPKESVKKYKDLTEPSADWADLSLEYAVVNVAAEEGQTLEEALLAAVNAADTGEASYLALPKKSTLTLSSTEIDQFNSALKTAAGVGKDVHVNLNNSTINAERKGTIFDVPDGATLEFSNGAMNIVSTDYNHAGFRIQTGGRLVLRKLDIDGLAYALLFPSSEAAEVIVDSCDIQCDAIWGLMTNGMTSDNIRIIVTNSKIANVVDGGGMGMLVNCGSNVHIDNSHITGSRHALVMRAGHVEIVNTTLETIADTAGDYKWDAFDHVSAVYRYWGTGNMVPGGVLVLGDHSEAVSSYVGDVEAILSKVKTITPNASEVPTVLLAARAQKNVIVKYDDTCSLGDFVLYDYQHPMGNGTVTVNGVASEFSEYELPAIRSVSLNPRYTIPASVGTFKSYSWYSVSDLGDDFANFKAWMADQGYDLTDAQWATARIQPGSTENVVKNLEYDSTAK